MQAIKDFLSSLDMENPKDINTSKESGKMLSYFPDYSFIKESISDDSIRYFLNGVYIAENHIVSTDGRQLHIIKRNTKELPKGLFTLKNLKKDFFLSPIDGQFPNYQKVIPSDFTEKIENITSHKKYGKQSESIIHSFWPLISKGFIINEAYLEALGEDTWTIYTQGDTKKAVCFLNAEKNRFAVIMPMQD
jgi:hypothetical protein